MKQVGRNVFNNEPIHSKYDIQLSWFRSLLKKYYDLRIAIIDKRKTKYAKCSSGYQYDLFRSLVYLKQVYLYKIESLYSKQELREYEKQIKKDVKEGRASKIKPWR